MRRNHERARPVARKPPDPTVLAALRFSCSEGAKDVGDSVSGFEGVSQRLVKADLIDVVAAVAGAQDVAGVDEVLHDAVHGTFANADESGDFGQADFAVLGDADQYVGVVRQKRPRR